MNRAQFAQFEVLDYAHVHTAEFLRDYAHSTMGCSRHTCTSTVT